MKIEIRALRDTTRELMSYLFPPYRKISKDPKIDYKANHILFRSGIIYGKIGSGKTTTVLSLFNRAVRKYGVDRCNVVIKDEGSLQDLVDCMDGRAVQLLFLDDFTLQDIDEDEIRGFYRIRHLWSEAYNRNTGLIVAFFGTHRFHGLSLEIRTNADILIARSVPLNPYDRGELKRILGDEAIEYLEALESKVNLKHNRSMMKYSVVKFLDRVGVLNTALPRKLLFSFRNRFSIPIEDVEEYVKEMS